MECMRERAKGWRAPAGVGFSELRAEGGTVPTESKRAFLPIEALGYRGHPAFLSTPWGKKPISQFCERRQLIAV